MLQSVAPRAPSAHLYVQSHIVFRFMNAHPTRILVLLDERCKNTDNVINSTLQENERPLNSIVHSFSIQYVSRQGPPVESWEKAPRRNCLFKHERNNG